MWAQTKSKHQLLDCVRHTYPPTKYKIQKTADKIAADFSIKTLFLPVAHTELNQLEMVLEFLKRAVASKNMAFKLLYVEDLMGQMLNEVITAMRKKFCNHTLVEERNYLGISRDLH